MKEEIKEAPNELMTRAIPAAEGLIKRRNFSVENLCHELHTSLRDVVLGIGSVDELLLHVNFHFMGLYVEKAARIDAEVSDHAEAIKLFAIGWLEHALQNPEQTEVLLQHKWEDGFERPEWYMRRGGACFAPIEKRVKAMAPGAPEQAAAGAARAIYAMINGLYFLGVNERASPAGIASQHRLLEAGVAWILKGLKA